MTPQEILDIIEAFFAAITKILVALGIIKEEEAEEDVTQEA